jgi:hypothetical protein
MQFSTDSYYFQLFYVGCWKHVLLVAYISVSQPVARDRFRRGTLRDVRNLTFYLGTFQLVYFIFVLFVCR